MVLLFIKSSNQYVPIQVQDGECIDLDHWQQHVFDDILVPDNNAFKGMKVKQLEHIFSEVFGRALNGKKITKDMYIAAIQKHWPSLTYTAATTKSHETQSDSDDDKQTMGGMTRFNHEGKAYECVTSDLMDISRPVNDDGDKPDKDDPDDKGDKPDKDDDPDDNDDPDDEGIHINIMEAFLVIVSYFTSDFEYVLLF